MAGITIDPKLAGFGESQPAPAPQTVGGGITIDPSMVDFSAPQQQAQQPTKAAVTQSEQAVQLFLPDQVDELTKAESKTNP